MGKKLFLVLGLVTLIGMGGVGLLIAWFGSGLTFTDLLMTDTAWLIQLGVGLAFGTISAIIGWQVIRARFMSPVRKFYGDLIADLKLGIPDVIYISLCAGIGEELLFRAGIQPLMQGWTTPTLGIWLTSFVFVAMHGYLNPWNWRISVYGVIMTCIIAGIGYLYDHMGLIAAASAHFAIDVVLLMGLTGKNDGTDFQQEEGDETVNAPST